MLAKRQATNLAPRQISQEEAVRRSWVLLGAAGFLGVSESQVLRQSVGML